MDVALSFGSWMQTDADSDWNLKAPGPVSKHAYLHYSSSMDVTLRDFFFYSPAIDHT